MALHFHTLRIQEIIRETPDCISVRFEVPESLAETFRFLPGQNVTLRTQIQGEDVRRSYSICKAPFENQLAVAIKKVNGGLFSTYANEQFQIGDMIDVMPPTGKFHPNLEPLQQKNYLMLAAGSGITPIISLTKTILREEPQSTVTLVYGNKSRSQVIFFEALEGLKNKYLDRFTLTHVLSREKTDAAINHGRINYAKLETLWPLLDTAAIHEAFICGPEEMIFASRDFLQDKGLSASHIHFELFGTAAAKRTVIPSDQRNTSDTPTSQITIRLDGRTVQFPLAYDSESILDAALQQGADLPFACKGGVCCTCKAKLIAGEIDMAVNYALEPEEVIRGYILTCQARPKTAEVEIDFDQR
jgi:ring-1,2-phenylacetyl-CoA epoxidase subunit PaaE